MFNSSGISVLVLSLALCLNALNLNKNIVNTVCDSENEFYSLAKQLTPNGTKAVSDFISSDVGEKIDIIDLKFCSISSFIKLKNVLPKELLTLIGCTSKNESMSYTHCQRFQIAKRLLDLAKGIPFSSGLVYDSFDKTLNSVVSIVVKSFDSVSIPKLKKLNETLADQNQKIVSGILQKFNTILDSYKATLIY